MKENHKRWMNERCNNIFKLVKGLSTIEKSDLLFALLSSHVLDFVEISISYVRFLEVERQESRNLVVDLATCAQIYKEKYKTSDKKLTEIKYCKSIIGTGLYSGTEYEESLIKRLKELGGYE